MLSSLFVLLVRSGPGLLISVTSCVGSSGSFNPAGEGTMLFSQSRLEGCRAPFIHDVIGCYGQQNSVVGRWAVGIVCILCNTCPYESVSSFICGPKSHNS